jgi:hypothetical protein
MRSQAHGTEATAQAVTHLLNYCATHPDCDGVERLEGDGEMLVGADGASFLSLTPLISPAGDGLNPSRRVVYIQQKYGFPSSGRLASSRRFLSEDRCCMRHVTG